MLLGAHQGAGDSVRRALSVCDGCNSVKLFSEPGALFAGAFFVRTHVFQTARPASEPSGFDGVLLPKQILKKEIVMDKEHVKGALKDTEGKAKEAAGKATGNDKLKTEGKVDQAEGAARKAAGDVKDAVKKK